MMSSQFGTDQSFHVSSSETVATIGFLGWNAIAAIELPWP